MRLARTERDYYSITITTTPALTGVWEASFDGGLTWLTGVAAGANWAWLVAGPDFDAAAVGMDPAATQAVISASTTPLLRLADNPVLDVETGPPIYLV